MTVTSLPLMFSDILSSTVRLGPKDHTAATAGVLWLLAVPKLLVSMTHLNIDSCKQGYDTGIQLQT